MRKYKKGESVIVVMPNADEVSGTVLRVSPDNRNIVVRIDDDTEILTEPQFLKDNLSATTSYRRTLINDS